MLFLKDVLISMNVWIRGNAYLYVNSEFLACDLMVSKLSLEFQGLDVNYSGNHVVDILSASSCYV